jgi:hypothetical protein
MSAAPRAKRAPGYYSDILRVVGRLLEERAGLVRPEGLPLVDRLNAPDATVGLIQDLEIIEHEVFMAVSWRSVNGSIGHQAHTELNLAELVEQARGLRGGPSRGRAGEYQMLLRALGQRIDADQIQVSGIFEKENEFVVTGISHRRYVAQPYTKKGLRVLNIERQFLRTAALQEELAEPEGEVPQANRSRSLLRRMWR